MRRSRLARALRWPPLHFAVGGVLLFLGGTLLQPSEGEGRGGNARVVQVPDARVAALRAHHEVRTGLPADAATERSLVERFVEEEILYREALLRGLATENPAVIGRLRQKLEFLGEDHGEALDDETVLRQAANLGLADEDVVLRNMFVRNMRLLLAREGDRQPTPEEVEFYYRSHANEFQRPARVSWRHVFLDRDARPGRLSADAEPLLARLRGRASTDPAEIGDPFVAGSEFKGKTRRQIEARFGEAFAAAVLEVPEGEWSMPIASPFGLHLVWIDERIDEHVAPLNEVQDRVALAWRREMRERHLARALAELRSRYEVVYESDGRREESSG